jgi:phosphatidate cytidylyltransferase
MPQRPAMNMLSSPPTTTLLGIAIVLTILNVAKACIHRRFLLDSYLTRTWVFFLSFAVAAIGSVPIAIWILALLCFSALREYFSLVDIRLQDRLGILGAYLSIPFMFYFVQIDWYGMFIIAIPVYSFLAIPLLISLGGRQTRGTVFSIGAIDFGLFLIVYCMGHIGYLMLYSPWMAGMLITNVAVGDVVIRLRRDDIRTTWTEALKRFLITVPLTVTIAILLSGWSGIPIVHSVWLGIIIPILVIMGHHTSDYVEADLGIHEDLLLPGRGQILDDLKALLFAAPVVFHYIRYFLT